MDEDRGKRVVEALAKDAMMRNESGPARELYWDECGIEQKVERVRDALLRAEHLIEVMNRRAAEALKISKFHEHNRSGSVLVPTIETYPTPNEIEFNVRGIFYQLHGEPPSMHGATIAGSLRKR